MDCLLRSLIWACVWPCTSALKENDSERRRALRGRPNAAEESNVTAGCSPPRSV